MQYGCERRRIPAIARGEPGIDSCVLALRLTAPRHPSTIQYGIGEMASITPAAILYYLPPEGAEVHTLDEPLMKLDKQGSKWLN
jgi:hypothetical protein